MNLTDAQWKHLVCLRWAKAVKEYDKRTRREYKWEFPTIASYAPAAPNPIRVNVLNALCDRKLVRWISMDLDATPGYYCLTAAGRKLVNDTSPWQWFEWS
jgi:hypothetical protein